MSSFIKAYPFSILTIALICYLSFFTPPSTKLDNVIGFDKVVHFGMYGFLCTVILWEQWRDSKSRGGHERTQKFNLKLFAYYFILPIAMSGLIEILQENCTGGRRSGDVYDFVANSLGVICASLIVPKVLEKLGTIKFEAKQ